MTIEEIQAKLGELRALMADRGIELPDPEFDIKTETICVYLGFAFDGHPKFHYGANPEECFKSAFAAVRSLPDAEEASAMRYRKSLAATLEVAREEAIEDEFVAPVKTAMDTFTEKALPNFAGDKAPK